MKKKIVLSTLFSTAVIGMAMLMSSCQQGSQPADNVTDKYDAVIYNVPDVNAVDVPEFQEGTIEHEMIMCPPKHGGDKGNNGNGKGMGRGVMDSKYIPLGKILRQLKLTDVQLAEIQTYILAQNACFKDVELSYRTQRLEILTAANDTRKLILDSLANGQIDTLQARKDLIALNADTRSKLAPIDKLMATDLKACLCSFLSQVTTLIDTEGTDAQKALWARWITRYKTYCQF